MQSQAADYAEYAADTGAPRARGNGAEMGKGIGGQPILDGWAVDLDLIFFINALCPNPQLRLRCVYHMV